MSNEIRTLQFGVIIRDYDYWTPASQNRAMYESEEWPIEGLIEAMVAAGEDYITQHRDVFASKEIASSKVSE